MSDTERDAWLREALRHAPDANAAPPSDLSESILAQARVAARGGGAAAPGARHRNPVLAVWDWLARPPVAAGFASVMVATLVGLMWWDQPIDETRPPRPEVARQDARPADVDRASPYVERVPPAAPANNTDVGEERPPAATVPAAPRVPGGGATAPVPQVEQERSKDTMSRDDRAPASAKLQMPQAATPPPPPYRATTEAKEPQRKREAADGSARTDRAAPKPSPFARSDDERAAVAAATPAKKMDSDANEGKASERATGSAAADALAAGDAPLAKSKSAAAAPTAPAEALRAEPPAAFAGRRANEVAQTAPTANAESETARRSRAAGAVTQAPPTPSAAPAVPVLRDSASAELREKQASAFGSSRTAQPQSDLASAQRQGAVAAPLAPIVAAIASDPSRWSRSTAAGSVVALEPGWRDWLAQLEAAARGRWQQVVDAAGRERDGASTLRLVDGGRTAAVVRLDGTNVRVDTIDRGERWQATLPPAVAERLRAAAEDLGR